MSIVIYSKFSPVNVTQSNVVMMILTLLLSFTDASVSSSTQQVQPPGLGGADLLAGLSGPPTQVSSTSPSQAPQAASRAGDPWGEFASAG